ncbi:MAG TPA: DUF2207 domain-containing protein [Candidatus Moranbacteria bacterium]|nr:DUF2207 domain-containing protein [Candidatus Moranbacteria bacterium]
MKKINKIIGLLFFSLFLFIPFFSEARENITDWYILDFESEIKVNEDSTLLITEKITADCGNLPGKHGIFRVLPTAWKTTKKTVKMPVSLISITDFDGKSLNYKTIKDTTNNTITWKIGDADKTVNGVNYYKITYKIENAIIFDDPQFDEWYWNLTGNFWDIDIDKFKVKIIFPEVVDNKNSQVEYYTGILNSKDKNLAEYKWTDKNILEFNSLGTIYERQGVTVSVTFPKNIFIPYEPPFWEKWHWILAVFLPILIFFFCFKTWVKYGKDPRIKKTIIPEFGIPENITPIQMGMVMDNGSFSNEFISAAIINLAVKKIIIIEETEKKVTFFKLKDIKIKLIKDDYETSNKDAIENLILKKMLGGRKSIELSSLKNNFNEKLSQIEERAEKDIIDRGWITKRGLNYKIGFIVLAIVSFIVSFFLFFVSIYWGSGVGLSGLILFIFGLFMAKRTPMGAELNWKIKGFKLYMETAEKYRQKFYEKENIFEKFLPYAIVFGIAKEWAKKMEEIYGADYFKNYHPVWYVGSAGNLASFDTDSFTSKLNSISSSVSSNTSSSGSGAGGGGGSGGGGGGGGGGGW